MHSSSSLVELPNPGSEPRARLLPVGGKLLVLADYSGLRASMEKRELLEVIAEVRRLILADAQSKLVLTDASHTQTDGEVLAALKSLAKEANLRQVVERECVVGLSRLQHHLLELVNVFAKSKLVSCKDRAAALSYLLLGDAPG